MIVNCMYTGLIKKMKITRRKLRKIISEVIIKEQNEQDDSDIDKIINLMMDDFDYGLELLGYLEPPVSLRYVRGKVAKRMNSMSHEDKTGLRQEEYHGLRDVWTNLYKRTSFLGIGKKGITENTDLNQKQLVDIWDWAGGKSWPGSTNWDLTFPRLFKLMRHQLRWMDDSNMEDHEKNKALYDWTIKHLDRTLLNIKSIDLYDSNRNNKTPLDNEEKLTWSREFLKVLVIDNPELQRLFVSKFNGKYHVSSLENTIMGAELAKSLIME